MTKRVDVVLCAYQFHPSHLALHNLAIEQLDQPLECFPSCFGDFTKFSFPHSPLNVRRPYFAGDKVSINSLLTHDVTEILN